MASKSIPQQILDEFIDEILKENEISINFADSLKSLLESGKAKKSDIVKLLEEAESNEDTRT